MEQKSIDYKVPGGKLLRIDAELDNKIIRRIKIHGDFFIHPETGIEKIEKFLIGKNADEENLSQKIAKAAKGLRMIGVSADDISLVLKRLIND